LVRAVVRGEVQTEGDVDALVERAVDWYQAEEKEEAKELDLDELWRHVKPGGGLDDLKLDDRMEIGYVYKTLGSGSCC
jgi:hypothetical protein